MKLKIPQKTQLQACGPEKHGPNSRHGHERARVSGGEPWQVSCAPWAAPVDAYFFAENLLRTALCPVSDSLLKQRVVPSPH